MALDIRGISAVSTTDVERLAMNVVPRAGHGAGPITARSGYRCGIGAGQCWALLPGEGTLKP